MRRDGDGLAGPGITVLASSPRLHRKDSEATDRDATATGKGIGDGREHATHVGVGTRLGYVRSATTRAESSTLFIQVSVLASVRVSVSRYPRSSGTDPPGFHRAGRTGADAGIRDPCHREGHSAPEWLGYMVLGMPSQTNGRGVRACARRWR